MGLKFTSSLLKKTILSMGKKYSSFSHRSLISFLSLTDIKWPNTEIEKFAS